MKLSLGRRSSPSEAGAQWRAQVLRRDEVRRGNRKLWSMVLCGLTALLLVVPMSGRALAAPPTGGFLSPDDGATGPGATLSDVADGTNGTAHIVARVSDPDASAISSVTIQTEDGDSDAAFETIGSATRVGSTDTWELFWDMSAYTPATDIDNDAGTLRAVVTDATAETANIDLAVLFNTTADAVEITSPANGGALGFFGTDCDATPTNCAAQISGTSSAALASNGEVDAFFSSSAVGNPSWTACGEATVTAGTTTNTWTVSCSIAGSGVAPSAITAVSVIADNGDDDARTAATDSGDGHRVSGYAQSSAGSSVTITPASDTQSIGFCNTYTLTVLDSLGSPIIGADVEVNGTGPADDLQFATNADEASITDTTADAFTSPTTGTGYTYEAAAGCDTAGEADGAADDADDDDTSDATPAASEAGAQGEVDTGSAAADLKSIEGATDANGFQFSLDSETAGSTAIVGCFDTNGDDSCTSEPQASAAKTWQAAAATNVDGTPEQSINLAGQNHTMTCAVTDQNANPRSGEVCRFNAVSGPDADDDNDANIATPNGYVGDCTTIANGTCSFTFTAANQGSETGTDVFDVFVNSSGESGTAVFAADSDDPKDTGGIQKTYTSATAGGATCIDVDPNTETVGTTQTQVLTAFVTNGAFDAAGDTADTSGQSSSDCGGSPVSGIAVDWSVTGDDVPDVSITSTDIDSNLNTERTLTDANGATTVTIDNVADVAGTNTWAAVADLPGVVEGGSAAAQVVWAAAGTAATVDCTPTSDLNATGTSHTVTGTVTDAFGTPISGQKVDFQVTGGPHSNNDLDSNALTAVGVFGDNVSTTASGTATASYTGSETGTDTITCALDNNDDDLNNELTGAATKQWATSADIAAIRISIDLVPTGADTAPGATNAQTCNGLFNANFDTDAGLWEATATNNVNNVHLVCVGAADTGNAAVAGASITLTSSGVGTLTDSTGPSPSQSSQTVATNSSGYALFYIFSTSAGTQSLSASFAGGSDTDTATKTWALEAAEARIIDCSPETDTNPPGTQHTVTCATTDGFGNPVSGVTTTFTRTDAGGANSAIIAQSTSSDTNGTTFITISSSTAGTTTVSGTIPAGPTTECGAAAGVDENGAVSNDTGKPAGVCSDGVTKTWSTTQGLQCWDADLRSWSPTRYLSQVRPALVANGRHGYSAVVTRFSTGGTAYHVYKRFCDRFARANADRETSRNRQILIFATIARTVAGPIV